VSIAIIYCSFLGQGIPSVTKGLSGRILTFSICLTGALFFWSYSAGLVSFLTIEKFEFPVQTIKVSALNKSIKPQIRGFLSLNYIA
jgi:hypothetical protein